MTTVTSATSTAATTSTSSNSTIVSDYETFLKLMTTQLQNQDPTDPMDSSEYATQLATFSQVEQQVRTNDLLSTLSSQLGGTGLGQYASWVGMEALATTTAAFDGTTPITLAPEAASGADSAVLVVTNAAGAVVDSQEVSLSSDTIEWDGLTSDGKTLAAGNYSFSLQSYSNGELVSTDDVALYTEITEVRQDTSGDTVLVTASGTELSADDIQALRAD